MVKVDKTRFIVYLDRAEDCFNAIQSLQVIYYDTEVKPDYLKEYSIKNFDVIFMLYSISIISLINCLTIKVFGEKGSDHKDLSLYDKLKNVFPDIIKFNRAVYEINDIKNSSEYGDKHYTPNKVVDIKTLKEFIRYTKEKTGVSK